MTTCNDLVIDVQGLLNSWNSNSEQVTGLATPMAATDLTFTVSSVASPGLGVSPGIIELDEELILVANIDNNGVASIPPFGRGYLGTVAAAHTAGIKVTSQPTFPRAKVMDALNKTIGRVYPDLYAVKTQLFTTTVPSITYDLADTADQVLDARWQDASSSQYWHGVRNMRMQPNGSSGGLNPTYGNVTVDIFDAMPVGRPLQITYASEPTPFTHITDDFSVTGFYGSMLDVLTFGAARLMLPAQELSRLQTSSIEQQNRSGLVAPSAALTASRWIEQTFEQRLKEEAASLRSKYGVRIDRTWL